MTEKSFFGVRLGRKPKALTTVERLCPAGKHPLDPGWTKCPYCEAESGAGTRSSRIAEPPPASSTRASRRPTQADPDPSTTSAAPATRDMPPSPPGRRHTMVDPKLEEPGDVHAGGGRRLTGIVTTFTWDRLGTLYKVYDGRNYAGSGVVAANNNVQCDIYVPEDRTMSSSHFLILCQGAKTLISDSMSTNGTFLNGEQIDTRGVELPDNAVIKAGATVFTFQRIHVSQGTPAASPAKAEDTDWQPGSEDELS